MKKSIMKRDLLAILLLAAGLPASTSAQSRPEFEVASIKSNKTEGGRSSMRATQDEVIFENSSLRKIVSAAYGVGEDRDYALSAPKLRESTPGTQGQLSMNGTHITGHGAPMQALADHLSNAALQLDRPVIDQTGLKGNYDFTLEWSPDNVPLGDSAAPSLFTAVQEQLGLKLDARKAPVEIIVVDSAEKVPTEN